MPFERIRQVVSFEDSMAKLAFDTGGTFTDFALLDDHGELHLHKVLSTPKNPAEAVVQGVGELLEQFAASIDMDRLQVLGATTVVTNAVLERKGVETAFVTTDGFQDMLRIRNEGRYDLYDLNIVYRCCGTGDHGSYPVRRYIRVFSGVAGLRANPHGCGLLCTACAADRPSHRDFTGLLRHVPSCDRGHRHHAFDCRSGGGFPR